MEWRVIDLGHVDCYALLSINDAIFEGVRDKRSPPTIFISMLKPSAVSVGRFQSLEMEVNLARCKELGIDLIRRQTAGGAAFHDAGGEVQYGVIAPEEMFPKDLIEGFRLVSGWLIDGLSELNIKAEFVPLNDIVVNGKKISGNAGVRKDGVYLQHGTMLYKPDIKMMFSVLNVSKEKIADKAIKAAEERVIGISSLVNVSIEELGAAMLKGLTKGKEYKIENKLTPAEDERARSLYTNVYKSDRWTYRK
jgi:lipoate---protein ligase